MNNPNINKASPPAGMNRKRAVINSLGLLVAMLFFPVATAQAAVYSFNVGEPPTTAMNGSGQTISVTGSGTFDTDLDTVAARGSYSISNSAGKVIERGTWASIEFGSFDSEGGPNPGQQGGVLEIWVSLRPNGGAPGPDQLMTVTCVFESGVFDEGDDSATVGDFIIPTGGITVFHLIKP